jgi:hypothetical protein
MTRGGRYVNIVRCAVLCGGAVLLSIGGLGCRTARVDHAQFPSTWPAGLSMPRIKQARVPVETVTPMTVAVAPWTWPEAASGHANDVQTTDVLTMLTQSMLQKQGFTVVDEQAAPYRLGCTIRDLHYTVHAGLPSRRESTALARCQLLRATDQRVLWQRQFDQATDETLYVDSYTRVTAYHERAFARETLPALVHDITEGLERFFRDQLPHRAATAASADRLPPTAGEPAPFQK